MDQKLVDKNGLVKAGNYLVMHIPANKSAMVYRVVTVQNPGTPIMDYGTLEISSGDTFSTYDGSSDTAPADGYIPANSFTSSGMDFGLTDAYDENDMWYIPDDYRQRIFHVKQNVSPSWLRISYDIPKGVKQTKFQRDNVITGVDKEFGFSRGESEIIHIPNLRYGYLYGNDTNIPAYTRLKFTYGEYFVEIPSDPNVVWDILTKRKPAYWVTMPIVSYDPSVKVALEKDYGFDGFPLYPDYMVEEAKSAYEQLIGRKKI